MCIASIKCFSHLICREKLTIFVNFLFSSSWELNKSMFTDFFCKYYCYLLLCSIEECVEKFICLFDGMKKMCGLKHYFVYDQFNSSNFCFIFNFFYQFGFFSNLCDEIILIPLLTPRSSFRFCSFWHSISQDVNTSFCYFVVN